MSEYRPLPQGGLRWNLVGQTATVSLDKSVGFDTRGAFRRLHEVVPDVEVLRLDFAKVETLESPAIGLIVLLAERCDELGVSLGFESIPDPLLRTFAIAKLHDRLDIRVSPEDRGALERYGRGR